MSSPEGLNPEQLRPLERGRWELLQKRLEQKVDNAGHLGIDVNYMIIDGANSRQYSERNAGAVLFGASVGKLGLAKMVIDMGLPDQQYIDWDRDRRDVTGAGRFDMKNAPNSATVSDLVVDMLGRSGNTAVRVLSPYLGGATNINAYYAEQGYEVTRVADAGDYKIFLGPTTPRESLKMLDALFDQREPKTSLLLAARAALIDNKVTNHGIRRHISPSLKLMVINKTGDYPGDDDDPYTVAHDVGIVLNDQDQHLKYSIMTKSKRHDKRLSGLMSHRIAERTVSQMGAEIAYALQSKRPYELGARAIRS